MQDCLGKGFDRCTNEISGCCVKHILYKNDNCRDINTGARNQLIFEDRTDNDRNVRPPQTSVYEDGRSLRPSQTSVFEDGRSLQPPQTNVFEDGRSLRPSQTSVFEDGRSLRPSATSVFEDPSNISQRRENMSSHTPSDQLLIPQFNNSQSSGGSSFRRVKYLSFFQTVKIVR